MDISRVTYVEIVPDLSVYALKSDVTDQLGAMAGTNKPPPVATDGVVGGAVRFAREDHTHKSSMWAGFKATDANGVAAFAFAPGFFDAAPVVVVGIENSDATALFNPAVTNKTKDGVTVTVKKVTSIALGLLTVSVPVAGLIVNVFARKASA